MMPGVKCSAASHRGRVKKENVTVVCHLEVFSCAKCLCSCLSSESLVIQDQMLAYRIEKYSTDPQGVEVERHL